jgi:hypothetical protein
MSLDDNEILNYLVRMVVPMRREFGRKLDVGQFMHDFRYATEVLQQARVSLDPRLREYGLYVEKRMHGARIADSTPPTPTAVPAAKAAATPAPPAPAPSPAADKATEDELRARVLKKYTSGLR